MRPSLLSLLLALLALAACGPKSAGTDAGSDPDAGASVDAGADAGPDAGGVDAGPVDAGFAPFDVEQWCHDQALAQCGRELRCLTLDEAKVPDCLERAEASCHQAELTAAVHGNRLQFLSQQAADCLNAYAHGSCTDTPTECEPVFQGLVSPDGGCLLPVECQTGSYCLGSSNVCPSICHAYVGTGEPCNYWDRQCDPETSVCRTVDGGMGCVARAGVGEACTYFSDCRPDLGCIDGACITLSAGLGEECGVKSGYPSCPTDAFCRQDLDANGTPTGPGVCERKAGLGGACSGYGGCLPGLRCSALYATGTCIPRGSEGDGCIAWDDCRSELYCDAPSSRCRSLPADGGDCGSGGSFYRCAAGYACDYADQLCHPPRGIGEPCSYDGLCQSQACAYGDLPDGGMGMRCVEACVSRLDGGF